jgi:hypothetical protein
LSPKSHLLLALGVDQEKLKTFCCCSVFNR